MEVQIQEKAVCPYNSNHKIVNRKYIYHIARCKQGKKMAHMFSKCQYNSRHIVKKQQLLSHQSICPNGIQIRNLARTIHQMVSHNTERGRSIQTKIKFEEDDDFIYSMKMEERDSSDFSDQQLTTLSDCDECQTKIAEILSDSSLKKAKQKKNPRLFKLLNRYKKMKGIIIK